MAVSKWPDVQEKLTLITGWARDGLSDKQICNNLGISEQTFYNYKKDHIEFFEAIKKGKEVIDYEVENALLKRALGYRYEEETKEMDYAKNEFGEQLYDASGNPILVLKTTKSVIKEVPPDVGAMAFWLKNRKPATWREKRDLSVTSTIDVKTITDEELEKRIMELEEVTGVIEDE